MRTNIFQPSSSVFNPTAKSGLSRVCFLLLLGLGSGAIAGTSVVVTNTVPSHAATDVAAGSDIVVQFSGPISNDTVTAGSFRVWGSQSGYSSGSFSFSPVTFDPDDSFKAGEEVVVMLSTAITSAAGSPIESYQFQFEAEAKGCEEFYFLDSGQSIPAQSFGSENDVALGDLDGDGDLDAFIASDDAPNTVWINDGNGVFTDSGQTLSTNQTFNVTLGDIDADGDLDAFVSNLRQPDRLWTNNGTGGFGDSGQLLGTNGSLSADFSDLDGDGDLDLFIADFGLDVGTGGVNRVWVNDGTGNFSDTGQLLGSNTSTDVLMGDLDGDGDADAFVSNFAASNRVYFNDGSGIFTTFTDLPGTNVSTGLDLGDVDGDGDLDAFVVNLLQPDILWTNNGSGAFGMSTQILDCGESREVALADFDADGDLDAIIANSDSLTPGNCILTNDGSGNFTSSGAIYGENKSFAVATGDVNGDGDIDAFVLNFFPDNRIWYNVSCVDTGDLDNDGMIDGWEVAWGLNPTTNDAALNADGDPNINLEEFYADTDPLDENAFWQVTGIQGMSPAEIFFDSSTARVYSLEFNDSLPFGSWQYTPGQTNIPGNGGADSLLDPAADPARAYRVRAAVP